MKRMSIESIQFRNMGFSYHGGEKVFHEFNFEFPSGEILFLQGARGSGKNTLMKIMLGLIAPTEGEFLINGSSVNDYSYSEFDFIRLNIGHSFDVGGLLNNQTLYENFRLILDYHDFQETKDRFDYIVQMLGRFKIDNQKHLRPALVSSSTVKAASVLRAFALKPQMIILDNPTQGMSKEHIPHLVELIQEHREKHGLKYILISSEDVSFIELLNGKIFKVTQKGLLCDQTFRKVS